VDYLTFHLVFTVPVALLLVGVYAFVRNPGYPAPWGVVLVSFIALLYTTPWDSYMIRQDVWWYGDGVVGARLWEVPLGEYFFFVIQTVVTGFWLYLVLTYTETESPSNWRGRLALPVVAVGITGAAVAMILHEPTFYTGMILLWTGPVLVVQWAYGGHFLLRNIRVAALGTLPVALYLLTADRFAVEMGLWVISDELTTGLTVLGLPIEEGLFFVVTNVMAVQGILLFRWTLHNWRAWYDEYGHLLPDPLDPIHERDDAEVG